MVESVKQEQSLQAPSTRISMNIRKNFEEVKTVEKKKVLLTRRGQDEAVRLSIIYSYYLQFQDISKDDKKINESSTSSEEEEEKGDNLSEIAVRNHPIHDLTFPISEIHCQSSIKWEHSRSVSDQ